MNLINEYYINSATETLKRCMYYKLDEVKCHLSKLWISLSKIFLRQYPNFVRFNMTLTHNWSLETISSPPTLIGVTPHRHFSEENVPFLQNDQSHYKLLNGYMIRHGGVNIIKTQDQG